jgi:hypothetical protein
VEVTTTPRRSSLTHCSPARKKINRQLARIERALNHSKQTTELRINRQLSRGPSIALFHSIDASPRHPAPNYSMRNIGANKRPWPPAVWRLIATADPARIGILSDQRESKELSPNSMQELKPTPCKKAKKRLIATLPNSKTLLSAWELTLSQFLTATKNASLETHSLAHRGPRIAGRVSRLTPLSTLASQLPPLPALPLCYSHRVPPNGLRALAPTRPRVSGSLPLFPAKEVILCAS